jgi:hypothetical protein
MAVLHKKEEKIQAVLGRLSKKYTHEEFVEMFIKLYSKDWGKIKSAYIKQSQDKEPGTVINMPKPDLYLKQVLTSFLKNNVAKVEEAGATEVIEVVVEKLKDPVKKKAIITEEKFTEVKKPKVVRKKKEETTVEPNAAVKKPKVAAKKKVEAEVEELTVVKKQKTVVKKNTADTETTAETKKNKATKK